MFVQSKPLQHILELFCVSPNDASNNDHNYFIDRAACLQFREKAIFTYNKFGFAAPDSTVSTRCPGPNVIYHFTAVTSNV